MRRYSSRCPRIGHKLPPSRPSCYFLGRWCRCLCGYKRGLRWGVLLFALLAIFMRSRTDFVSTIGCPAAWVSPACSLAAAALPLCSPVPKGWYQCYLPSCPVRNFRMLHCSRVLMRWYVVCTRVGARPGFAAKSTTSKHMDHKSNFGVNVGYCVARFEFRPCWRETAAVVGTMAVAWNHPKRGCQVYPNKRVVSELMYCCCHPVRWEGISADQPHEFSKTPTASAA